MKTKFYWKRGYFGFYPTSLGLDQLLKGLRTVLSGPLALKDPNFGKIKARFL
jgi:hypothetical protein